MLIDDSEADLLYTQIVLERSGLAAEVLPFEEGEQALQALRSGTAGQVDLILLDINMPRMDGFEFLDAYEALEAARRAGAVVVMLTSSPDPADRERALGYPCVKGYAVKPLDLESARDLARYVGG
ncbi:MAG: response regulator [Rubrivivax sp.]|nr:response regulator [Rubrivivax sp.]